MILRRVAVSTVIAGLAASTSMGIAQAVPAPVVGAVHTITVGYDQTSHQFAAMPDTLELGVGETVKVVNEMSEGSGDPNFYVAVINGTGSVRMGATSCSDLNCKILDDFPNNPYATFTAVDAGTIRIVRFDVHATPQTARMGSMTITANQSIEISGSRGSVSGKPGVIIEGSVAGIRAGSTVIPYIRFPGQTSYTQGTARPEISAAGTFTYARKTGKKTYIYFTNANGDVVSNRVIIAAA